MCSTPRPLADEDRVTIGFVGHQFQAIVRDRAAICTRPPHKLQDTATYIQAHTFAPRALSRFAVITTVREAPDSALCARIVRAAVAVHPSPRAPTHVGEVNYPTFVVVQCGIRR